MTLLGITVSDAGGCPKVHDGSRRIRRSLKTRGYPFARRSEDASEGYQKKPKVSKSYRKLLEPEGDPVARRPPEATEGPRKRTRVNR